MHAQIGTQTRVHTCKCTQMRAHTDAYAVVTQTRVNMHTHKHLYMYTHSFSTRRRRGHLPPCALRCILSTQLPV